MKNLMLSITLLLMNLAVMHAVAQQFPVIETETVSGEKIEIPAALSGKKSIVFLAFTQKAEMMLDNWYAPVYTMFIDESGFNAMAYDCHVRLVMMFTGLGQQVADDIMEKIRENVDDTFNEHLMFYQGNFSAQMKALGLKKADDAYVFVLDEQGEILLKESGAYSESKLERIADLVEL